MKKIIDDFHYAIKSFRSLLSGYVALESRCTWTGEFGTLEDGDFRDDPYYVCPVFKNGRHIPLPLILDPNNSEYALQRVALWGAKLLRLKGYRDALHDSVAYCRKYDPRYFDIDDE